VFPLGAGPSNALASTGGASSIALATANLPAHAHSITDVAHNHGINQSPHNHGDPGHTHGASEAPHSHGGVLTGTAPTGGSFAPAAGAINVLSGRTDTQQPAITVNAAGTGIQAADANISLNASGTGLSTTNNTGSGTPVPTMPPFASINFIIKYQ